MQFNLKKVLFITALQFISGFTFAQEVPAPKPTSKPEPPQIYEVVDEPADFPGGMAALNKYLAENMQYPQIAAENGLQGKCFLQFIVSKNGYISNVKVKKGVADCLQCDQEAIRLVKSMPKWKPGTINGEAVNSVFNLPVSFKLN